jgi:hypothetical protein
VAPVYLLAVEEDRARLLASRSALARCPPPRIGHRVVFSGEESTERGWVAQSGRAGATDQDFRYSISRTDGRWSGKVVRTR